MEEDRERRGREGGRESDSQVFRESSSIQGKFLNSEITQQLAVDIGCVL